MIYLDLDGVLVDFVTPFLRVFGSKDTNETLTTYEIHTYLGKTREEAYEHPVVASAEFWAELPKLPWADDLVDFVDCYSLGEFAFLSQPLKSPASLAGKKAWMDKHYPDVSFALSNRKVVFAAPGKVLIDDYVKNIEEWDDRGGIGILFPARWNDLGHQNDPVPYVEESLRQIHQLGI